MIAMLRSHQMMLKAGVRGATGIDNLSKWMKINKLSPNPQG